MYLARHISRSELIPLRGLRYHVRIWGELHAATPPLFMLHGWMDVSASFQFVVDALGIGRAVIAPDWRGFGLTDARGADNFWFADYLADLDALLDHFSPTQAVDLVGHSMGANVSMFYAGARPARVRRVVNLEGAGLAQTHPEQAPARYAQWMDEIKELHRGAKNLQTYPQRAGVARRLMRTNPRLPEAKANWLAAYWARETQQTDGSTAWAIQGDAAHKVVSAHLYRVDEAIQVYRQISAPVLAVHTPDGVIQTWKKRGIHDDFLARMRDNVPRIRFEQIGDAGHMLHHDQPEKVAALIRDFLRS